MASTLAALVEAARSVLEPGAVAVGVGAAGMVALGTGHLLFAPNIAWRDVRLKELVHEATGLPVQVENDCTAAAYGEWRVGAAKGVRDVLYVGVGTGIGGGLVVDGRLYRGAHGYAGEIGHVAVEPDGLPCGCGNRGCWETVASGGAIARDGRRAVTRHAHSLLAELAGGVPDSVTGDMVSDAASQGDPAARGILAEVGARLGRGIAGLVNVLDPALVVVGGGASAAGELLLAPARHAYRAAVEGRGERPDVPLVAAALGPDGAAIGAALSAMDAAAPS
jgi:glucokinase